MSPVNTPALRKRKATPVTKLSPAERMAKVLAFRGPTYNFSTDRPTPSNGVPVTSSRFSTS